MKLPEDPTIQVSVRRAFFDWWRQYRDEKNVDETERLDLGMSRAAWRALARYIQDCENLIENTRVRGK